MVGVPLFPSFVFVYASKLQRRSPRATSREFEFLNVGLFKFQPPRQKLCSNAPPNLFAATVTFYTVTKLENLDLADLFFLTIRWRK